jgi:YD repeat-containing protein
MRRVRCNQAAVVLVVPFPYSFQLAPANAVTNLKVTTFKYDGKMNLTQTYTAPSGGSNLSGTQMKYDELGRETFVRRYANPQLAPTNADAVSLYGYDVAGNLSKLVYKGLSHTTGTEGNPTDSDDMVTEYTYDALRRKTKDRRSLGTYSRGETVYQYDSNGNVTNQKVLQEGTTYLTTSSEYDVLNRVTKVIDPELHFRTITYDVRGLRRADVGSSSGGTPLERNVWFYDRVGRVVTTATASPSGALTTFNVASDRVTQYTYDPDGHMLTQTNYNQGASTPLNTINQYDGIGRLTKTTDPAGLYTTMLYDAEGRVIEGRVYDGIGNRTFQQRYDDLGNLQYDIRVASNAANNLTTQYGYDVAGQLTGAVDPTSVTTTYTYDALGVQTRRVEDSGGIARTTDYTYDSLGRLITLTAFDNDSSPPQQSTIYEYDPSTWGGPTTSPMILVTYPNFPYNDLAVYWYDLTGRLSVGSSSVEYKYDKRGLLTSKGIGNYYNKETYQYDGIGRMTRALKTTNFDADKIADTTFAYNGLSCMTREIQELFGDSANPRTLNYRYDQQCNRQSLGYHSNTSPTPDDTMELAYQYDALSRNTKVRGNFRFNAGVWRDFIQYDYLGRNLTRGRLTTTYSYEVNPFGTGYVPPDLYSDYLPEYDEHRSITRITNRTFQAGAVNGGELDVLARFDYAFNAAGDRLHSLGDRGVPNQPPQTLPPASGYANIPRVPSYLYDGLHRLTTAQYDQGSGVTQAELFIYDKLANRITYSDERTNAITTYTHKPSNQYVTITQGDAPHSVGYDWAGNLALDENRYQYFYDVENRLFQVCRGSCASPTDEVGTFAYDALGRMITSTVRYDGEVADKTETLYFYYDGSEVIAEYDAANTVQRRYIHGRAGVDERAIMYKGPNGGSLTMELYYYLLRELDTVTGMMTSNGALAEGYAYDAYGKVRIWAFRPMDYDRDGDQDAKDYDRFYCDIIGYCADLPSAGVVPPGRAQSDRDMFDDQNGFIDGAAYATMLHYFTASGVPPVELRVSGVGNPYFFTGRRLHFLDTSVTSGAIQTEASAEMKRATDAGMKMSPGGEMSLLAGGGGGAPTFNRQLQFNRARHYDPHHGRWLQRDPAGYVDGMNLYEYVRSRPTVFVDPSGLWRIQREGRPRALAISDPGDTVDDLAQLIRLNADEYLRWLWGVNSGVACCPYPVRTDEKLEEDCEFSIPNTVTLIWGGLNWDGSWWVPRGILGQFRQDLSGEREGFKARGYHINELNGPTVDQVGASLYDRNLHIFLYTGHGGEGGTLVPRPPYDENSGVPERICRIEPFQKIGGMKLLACYSADQSCIVSQLNIPNMTSWRNNVSRRGVFMGFIGDVGPWNHHLYIDFLP